MNDQRKNGTAAFSPRATTLRIQRLLATPINLVRIEFAGDDVRGLARVGTVAVYGPFVAIGYLFLVAGLARLCAIRVGWGWSLLLLGAVHVAIGGVGLATGARQASSRVDSVAEPDFAPVDEDAEESADTLVTPFPHPPAFPPRTRTPL